MINLMVENRPVFMNYQLQFCRISCVVEIWPVWWSSDSFLCLSVFIHKNYCITKFMPTVISSVPNRMYIMWLLNFLFNRVRFVETATVLIRFGDWRPLRSTNLRPRSSPRRRGSTSSTAWKTWVRYGHQNQFFAQYLKFVNVFQSLLPEQRNKN